MTPGTGHHCALHLYMHTFWSNINLLTVKAYYITITWNRCGIAACLEIMLSALCNLARKRAEFFGDGI